MTTMTIQTNNVPRPLLYWFDLTEKERADFDYLDTEVARDDAQFFRYKSQVYDLGEFTMPPEELRHWAGISADTYFSGVVYRWPKPEQYGYRDNDHVIVGRVWS